MDLIFVAHVVCMITIFQKNNNNEKKKGNKPYKNFQEEYELTHGDIHYYGKEVEVYQIIFV